MFGVGVDGTGRRLFSGKKRQGFGITETKSQKTETEAQFLEETSPVPKCSSKKKIEHPPVSEKFVPTKCSLSACR
jgi:hypothetical protein